MAEPGKSDFFVSYNKADKAWAEWIAWELEDLGYSTILQAWDFRPGQNFILEMQRSAAGCERTLAVLSPHYLASLYTQPEWAAALAMDPTGRDAKLIPVRVGECVLEGVLSPIVYIDLVAAGEEKAREALRAGVQRGRIKPAERPLFPGQVHGALPRPLFPGGSPFPSASAAGPRTTAPPRHPFGNRLRESRAGKALLAGASILAASGLVAGLVVRLRETGLPPAPGWKTRPLTTFLGMESSPSWSPDGGLIAYGHTAEGDSDIYVMPASGGERVRLTSHPADDVAPRWSPDGRHIAFLSDRGTGTDVYLVPPLGGAERKLAETGIPWLERYSAAYKALGGQPWSPDGQELLFSRLAPTGELAVWKVDLRTRRETRLTRSPEGGSDLAASWSFDGRNIVFQRGHPSGGALWVRSVAGGRPWLLLEGGRENRWPAWSADDRRVVFQSDRGGFRNLWDVDLASRHLRQLTTGAGQDAEPVVSRAGQLAYSEFRHQIDLYQTAADGRAERRLTSNTRDNVDARVSPDGTRVVYASDRTGNGEIWLLDLDSGAELQLTDHPAADSTPDWSPDGRAIVFASKREGGENRLWVMDTEGRELRRLTAPERFRNGAGQVPLGPPRWAPDGLAIGYIAGSDEGRALWLIDPVTGEARPRLYGLESFDWYRDSRHIVIARRTARGALEMRVRDLKTGREAVLLAAPTAELAVARDGSAIAYVHAASHYGMQLFALKLAPPVLPDELPRPLGEPRQVTWGRGQWHVHHPAWISDTRGLVYTRDTDFGDIYVIDNYF